MLKFTLTTTTALALFLGFASAANAAIISGFGGVGAGTSLVALNPAANAFLTGAPVVTTGAVGNNDFTGLGNPNTVSFSLDVYAMDVPFSLTFLTSDDGTAAQDGSTEYFFSVTLNNMLNANGIDPGDAGKEINGVDVSQSAGGAAATGFDAPPLGGNPFPFATGGAFPLQAAGIVPGPGNLRFGGLSGGGGGIGFGTSQTLNFAIDLADLSPAGASGPGTLTLTFTANPEPATFLLGGLALIPGVIAVRRRRQKRSAEQSVDALPV